MKTATIKNNLLKSLAVWESSLNLYSENEFSKKPSNDSWSIGQLYAHLIFETPRYHLKQIELCLVNTGNRNQVKTLAGKIYFFINGFLPVKIKVPASEEYMPVQPESKLHIHEGINKLKQLLDNHAKEIENKAGSKIKHPTLGYLCANEWFKLIEMHFRHHLQQKKRLDLFLGK